MRRARSKALHEARLLRGLLQGLLFKKSVKKEEEKKHSYEKLAHAARWRFCTDFLGVSHSTQLIGSTYVRVALSFRAYMLNILKVCSEITMGAKHIFCHFLFFVSICWLCDGQCCGLLIVPGQSTLATTSLDCHCPWLHHLQG